jgi:glycine/D-amino acid oxidase-like deaminating enzyme
MKVTIVGGGIMGLSTAWALRKRGADVTVLEQGPLPNPLGSSVDDHRMLRRAYGAERGYQRMMVDGFLSWDRLWADLGRALYVETGLLYFAKAQDAWLDASIAGLSETGVALEQLDLDEVARRFPAVTLDGVERAAFVPSSGALKAGEIVGALAGWLRENGARVRANTKVASVDVEHARVTLADGSRIDSDTLVVAAGPWTTKLLPGIAARMTPSRQILVYLDPPDSRCAEWQRMPVLADLAIGTYVVPPVAGMRMKIGDHRFSLAGDPDLDRVGTQEDTDSVLEHARRRFRDFDGFRRLETKTCFYDVTADEHFMIDASGRAFVLTGFSGHGFKFGAVIGERVAGAVLGEIAPADLARWADGQEG